MRVAHSFNDYQPVTWFRRMPIYVTTIITALFVAGMFATAIAAAARARLEWFALSPADLWQHGYVWQLLTYPLIQRPDFFYLFGIFFFYWFGVDVERYLGRSRYFTLLALLLLAPAVVTSLWWKIAGIDDFISGSGCLAVGFFIAFATLYPNLEYWGWITMKWIAFAGILLSSMNYLPAHDWSGLSVLLTTCAVSFGYVRFLQGDGWPEWTGRLGKIFRRRPTFRVVAKPKPQDDALTSIDPLLEKISKRGISSLTESERRTLERAREALVKRDGKSRP